MPRNFGGEPFLEAKIKMILSNRDGVFVVVNIFRVIGPHRGVNDLEYYNRVRVAREVLTMPRNTGPHDIEEAVRKMMIEKNLEMDLRFPGERILVQEPRADARLR